MIGAQHYEVRNLSTEGCRLRQKATLERTQAPERMLAAIAAVDRAPLRS